MNTMQGEYFYRLMWFRWYIELTVYVEERERERKKKGGGEIYEWCYAHIPPFRPQA